MIRSTARDGRLQILAPQRAGHAPSSRSVPAVEPDVLEQDRPDAHVVHPTENGGVAARCSLWWNDVPAHEGHQVGCIGHFAAGSRADATELLDAACGQLAERRCTLAVGPMNGSTWRDYRFVTTTGTARRFFLEPSHPNAWPGHFRAGGFAPLAGYRSYLIDLNGAHPVQPRHAARMRERDITIRHFRGGDVDGELRAIYAVAVQAFAGNFLFSPLAESEFMERYRFLAPAIDERLVLLACEEDRVVGFLFGVPDLAEPAGSEGRSTMIVKTLGILPGRKYAGLGTALVERCHREARAAGYTRAIHALVHEGNVSMNISGRYGRIMRRYTLFARSLAA